jgi:hypothetical protein
MQSGRRSVEGMIPESGDPFEKCSPHGGLLQPTSSHNSLHAETHRGDRGPALHSRPSCHAPLSEGGSSVGASTPPAIPTPPRVYVPRLALPAAGAGTISSSVNPSSQSSPARKDSPIIQVSLPCQPAAIETPMTGLPSGVGVPSVQKELRTGRCGSSYTGSLDMRSNPCSASTAAEGSLSQRGLRGGDANGGACLSLISEEQLRVCADTPPLDDETGVTDGDATHRSVAGRYPVRALDVPRSGEGHSKELLEVREEKEAAVYTMTHMGLEPLTSLSTPCNTPPHQLACAPMPVAEGQEDGDGPFVDTSRAAAAVTPPALPLPPPLQPTPGATLCNGSAAAAAAVRRAALDALATVLLALVLALTAVPVSMRVVLALAMSTCHMALSAVIGSPAPAPWLAVAAAAAEAASLATTLACLAPARHASWGVGAAPGISLTLVLLWATAILLAASTLLVTLWGALRAAACNAREPPGVLAKVYTAPLDPASQADASEVVPQARGAAGSTQPPSRQGDKLGEKFPPHPTTHAYQSVDPPQKVYHVPGDQLTATPDRMPHSLIHNLSALTASESATAELAGLPFLVPHRFVRLLPLLPYMQKQCVTVAGLESRVRLRCSLAAHFTVYAYCVFSCRLSWLLHFFWTIRLHAKSRVPPQESYAPSSHSADHEGLAKTHGAGQEGNPTCAGRSPATARRAVQ